MNLIGGFNPDIYGGGWRGQSISLRLEESLADFDRSFYKENEQIQLF